MHGQGAEPEGTAAATARLILSGPFRLLLDDGTDITPGSPLRQAILAVIAAAPGQIRARRTLQSMFWGSADPDRAAASLRTALHGLRRDLAPLGGDCLRADRLSVALAPGRLAVHRTPDGGEALEGLDLPLADCEGFEDWLRTLRQAAQGEAAPPAGEACSDGSGPSQGPPARPRPGGAGAARPLALALLPAAQDGPPDEATVWAQGAVDDIARFFAQFTMLDIHDLRGTEAPLAPLPLASRRGPTHLLQPVLHGRAPAPRLALRLLEAHSRRLIWLSEPMEAGGPDAAALAWRAAETIADRMRSVPLPAAAPDLFPYTAIAALFSLDPRLVDETETELMRMTDTGGHPVLHALLLFTQVFRVNEGLGVRADLDSAAIFEMLADLPASDPLLPLGQSLAGYAIHMLEGRNDLALHLIENAARLAPQLALNLDHLAVLRLVRGDLPGAETAFRRCLAAGAHSPWRYTYEVTGAMIHLRRGDLRRSLHHANQALFRKPRYLAALRYAMVGLALAGQPADARRMHARLQALRPGFDLSGWSEGLLRRAAPEVAEPMVRSLRASQLL